MSEVEVVRLSKRFRHRRERVVALNDVSLDIGLGELVVLLGPSGSGKSTLLRCVAGLERPDSGRIALGGRCVWDATGHVDVPPNRRKLGMMFQSYALWPHMTVRDNVAYPLRVQRHNGARATDRADELLRLVGCADLGDRYPSALSGGQQQRVGLARALVARPRVLLFDEPLSNVDALLRRELRQLLKRLHDELKFTGIYVTHDQSEAFYMGSRVAVMHAGEIAQIGSANDIYRMPASTLLASFVGVRNLLDLRSEPFAVLANAVKRHFRADIGHATTAHAGVRADDIRLSTQSTWDDRSVLIGEGILRRVSTIGDAVEYLVDVGSFEVEVLARDGEGAGCIGDRVWLTADLKRLLIYCDGHLISV